MNSRVDPPHLAQVAFSLPNVLPELRLFAGVLGYQPAGFRLVQGPLLARLQQLQNPVCLLSWLSGGAPFFQLEFFQYAEPVSHPKPAGWRACDVGYNLLSFEVPDIAAVIESAVAAGSALRGGPIEAGGARHACLETAAGILVEVVEVANGPLPARLRSLRASVPNLERARRFFVETLGFREAETPAEASNAAAREQLWGLAGARRRLLILHSANDVCLELAEYAEPSPAQWRRDARLSDTGIMNLALGFRDHDRFRAACQAVSDGGYWTSNAPRAAAAEGIDVAYTRDDQGFSVELLYCPASSDRDIGFIAANATTAARLRP